MTDNLLQKINKLAHSLIADPLTLKKAIILCCYVLGLLFAGEMILLLFNLHFTLLWSILFLVAVLIIARGIGKNELSSIFAWRNVPLPVFAAIMVMFFGAHIIRSELSNILQNLLPVPDGFFDGAFYRQENIFLIIVTGALMPGFTEEVFFRGIIARKFYRTYSPLKAILLSAALFGIMHLNPWQAVNSFLGGIFYGWIYWRYRSIWLCMFIHAYNNVLAFFMLYPFERIGISGSHELWRHPLWFVILGFILFGMGLFMVITLSRKDSNRRIGKTAKKG